MSKYAQLAISALQASRQRYQDLLKSFRAAFKGLSEKEMHEPWGMDGKTRRQIVEELEASDNEVKSAIAWLGGLDEHTSTTVQRGHSTR